MEECPFSLFLDGVVGIIKGLIIWIDHWVGTLYYT